MLPATRIGLLAVFQAAALAAAPMRGETQSVEFGVHKRMDSELFQPAGPGPYPGILLMHTAMGLEQYDLDYAQRLSNQGYVVLVPRFLAAYHAITILRAFREHVFKAYGPSMYDDFVAGLAMLENNPKVRGAKLGAIGFSAGGYFALWLAATGKVQAGVSYYGAVHAAGGDPNLEHFPKGLHRLQFARPHPARDRRRDGGVPIRGAARPDSDRKALRSRIPLVSRRSPIRSNPDRAQQAGRRRRLAENPGLF